MRKRPTVLKSALLFSLWGLAFCLPGLARAACSSPTGVAGQMVYNADHHVHQYCDDTDWIAMAVSAGDGGAGATPTTSGLVAYWTLDEGAGTTAADSAGSNDGTLVNSPTWTTGKVSGSLYFDGVDDRINVAEVGNTLEIGTGDMSWSFWIKTTSTNVADRGGIFNGAASGGSEGYLFFYWHGSNAIGLYIDNGVSTVYNSQPISGAVDVDDGQWHMITAVLDRDGDISYYADGVLQGTDPAPFPGEDITGSQTMQLARFGVGYMEGDLDDVRIYNRALSAAEIGELYSYGQLGGVAGCLAPAGVAGSINFNNDTRLLQYCDGDEWRALGTCGEDPESSKAAHWKLDESSGTSAADSTTNGLTGTLTNGPTWQSTGGQISGALSFDGTDDRVDLGSMDVSGSAITISAWMRADDFDVSDARLVSKASGVNEADHYWMLSTINTAGLRFRLKTDGTTSTLISADNVVASGQWYHVSVVYDGLEMKIYRNAELVASTPKTGNISTSGAVPAAIGDQPQGARAFDGLIDDVRIYNRALSSADIKALYDQGRYRTFDNGKVAHWPLDASSGTTAADLTGNAAGTTVNSPTWTPAGGRVDGTLDFDGSDDRIDAGSPAALDNLGAMTIVGWIRPDTLGEGPSLGRIIGKTTGNTAAGGWTLNLDTTNRLTFSVDYATTDLLRRSANNTITMGAWQHVAVTWNGSSTASNAIIYINGAVPSYATTTNASGARANDAAQNIAIGNPPTLTDRSFDGRIDDLRIYNRVLTAAEIASLYDAQISGHGCAIAGEMLYDATANAMKYCDGLKWRGFGDCSGDVPGTTAHWKLDETSGTTASDSSGNSLSGTLTNGPVWSSGALTLDGTDDYVSVSDPGAGSVLDFASGDSITVTAWVNPTALPGSWANFLVKSNTTGTDNANYEFGVDSLGRPTFSFTNPSGTWHALKAATGVVYAGSWQFVAFTGTFGMLQSSRFYYNGASYSLNVDVGSPYTTAPIQTNEPLWIGAENSGGMCCYYNGQLDDVRIYRRILSSDEIMNLYLRGR